MRKLDDNQQRAGVYDNKERVEVYNKVVGALKSKKKIVVFLYKNCHRKITTNQLTDAYRHARQIFPNLIKGAKEDKDCMMVLRHYTANLFLVTGVAKKLHKNENSLFASLPEGLRQHIFSYVPV